MTPSSDDSRLKAVVDSNLFVSGSIIDTGHPFRLLEAWRSEDFRLVIYEDQLGELHDVFARPKIARRVTAGGIQELFWLLATEARSSQLTQPEIDVRDLKDRKILAAALGGNADYLVTGDADLLVLDGDPRLGNLRVVTARVFLDILQTEKDSEAISPQ